MTKSARTTTTSDVVELTRRGYAALGQRNEQAMLATMHPDVEYHTIGLFPGLEPVYHGHDGMRELLRAMDEAFDVLQLTPERILETDNGAVVLTRWHARGRDSGAEVTLVSIDELETENDLLVTRRSYPATPENLERFGLLDPAAG